MIDALARAAARDVSRETFERLKNYVDLLSIESERQNLIAPSTLKAVWDRHILDSAQLLRFVPRGDASWIDIGSGAGLPGIVIALLSEGPITLIEPRRLRADFLTAAAAELGLAERVTVRQAKAERVTGRFDVITARAVAALNGFLTISAHLSTPETNWVLPKGRNAQSELAEAKRNWQCEARVEQSCTDVESKILVLTKVGTKRQ